MSVAALACSNTARRVGPFFPLFVVMESIPECLNVATKCIGTSLNVKPYEPDKFGTF
jgi:hypothetical protein